jgi:hypothetical protein
MKRFVRFSGRKLSGCEVVSSTVRSSMARADTSVGIRDLVAPTWSGAKCGALSSMTFCTFQTTASALKGEPSWKVTPSRRVKVHFVVSSAFTAQEVARPGMMTLGSVSDDRSQCVRASYIGMPVKRLPSKPWSGCPLVRGMSAAVMPMVSTFSAQAGAEISIVDDRARASVLRKAGVFMWFLPLVNMRCAARGPAPSSDVFGPPPPDDKIRHDCVQSFPELYMIRRVYGRIWPRMPGFRAV